MSERPDRSETQAVRERYARRVPQDPRYCLLNPAALLPLQERQRAVLRLFARLGWTDLSARRVLEVGCGTGSNLLELLLLGFMPEHVAGIELLPERHAAARERLPDAVQLTLGDATAQSLAPASFDVVFQATVFSSLLDDAFQQRLAEVMWAAVKPGGGVLWYDFTVDNPRNPDVRGVPLARVRALFPHGRLLAQRITLAPPVARAVVRLHPALYTLFNTVPALRTHVLCWIAKD
ncbi:MAG TPA: class I SAM-dependent methyltransferase [Albitalea sp.]|uniref:class I SAM-dependent methyltransferase n=1 Tax=Piscinibacter sp. TaxID=1903157 RepID=UPI002ED64D08